MQEEESFSWKLLTRYTEVFLKITFYSTIICLLMISSDRKKYLVKISMFTHAYHQMFAKRSLCLICKMKIYHKRSTQIIRFYFHSQYNAVLNVIKESNISMIHIFLHPIYIFFLTLNAFLQWKICNMSAHHFLIKVACNEASACLLLVGSHLMQTSSKWIELSNKSANKLPKRLMLKMQVKDFENIATTLYAKQEAFGTKNKTDSAFLLLCI